MIVSAKDFESFLKKFGAGNDGNAGIIAPCEIKSHQGTHPSFRFESLDEKSKPVLNSFRTIDPVKILFYLMREKVYPADNFSKRRIIAGVKACDLKALILLDKAMLESGFIDPAYHKWRKNTLIISTDCDEICKTCHCNIVGGKPYSEKGYDVNVSSLNGHYVLSSGTEQGKDFLTILKKEVSVSEESSEDAKAILEKRKRVFDLLENQNEKFNRPNDYSEFRKAKTDVWEEEAKECVGCGACTNICPTCYCLILNDETLKEQFVKVRSYDSCQWFGYARVAGGGSPRHKMTERFRNRYLCKFDYMNHNFEELGCTGCGRCTEACTAKIDFRKAVKNISNSVLVKS